MVDTVTASGWIKGITLSILASIIGGASKLAIRKSWILEEQQGQLVPNHHNGNDDNNNDNNNDNDNDNNNENNDTFRNDPETAVTARDSIGDGLSLSPTRSKPFEHIQKGTAPCDTHTESSNSSSNSSSSNSSSSNSSRSNSSSSSNNHHDGTAAPLHRTWLPVALRAAGMIGMTLLNPLCSVVAMNYASPSILAPFSGLTLVWIVLLANPVIGEQPTTRQVVAAGLIIFGEVIVAVFGDHTNDDGVSVQDVRDSYLHAPFLCYFAVLTLWMLLLWHWMRNSSSPTLKRFAWGVAGGSVTGLQNFLKDSLTILKAVNDPDSNAHGLPWYLFLLGLLAVVAAFGGLLLLTACMKRYDATYSAAMFVGSFVLSASLMSVVHYSTFQHLESLWNTILYPTGLLVLMGGVYVLVKAVKDVPQHDDDDDDGLNNGVDRSESSASQQRRILDNSDMHEPLLSNQDRIL